jgi:hypothetical protein
VSFRLCRPAFRWLSSVDGMRGVEGNFSLTSFQGTNGSVAYPEMTTNAGFPIVYLRGRYDDNAGFRPVPASHLPIPAAPAVWSCREARMCISGAKRTLFQLQRYPS